MLSVEVQLELVKATPQMILRVSLHIGILRLPHGLLQYVYGKSENTKQIVYCVAFFYVASTDDGSRVCGVHSAFVFNSFASFKA